MENKEIVMSEEVQIVDNIKNATDQMFCSFDCNTPEERKKLYNATTGTQKSLKDQINKVIAVTDVIVVPTDMKNSDGATVKVPRITLIDKKGEMYTASSWGIYNCIKRIHAIFGTLHFDEGLAVTPKDVKTKSGSTLNLELV